MTSTMRDITAKIERKVKKWRFNHIMDIFECIFVYFSQISKNFITLMPSILQKRQYSNLRNFI